MAMIRYTFLGTLELVGALHIGSGGAGRVGDGEVSDATIIRDSRGRPYIPGSSLRGALRAAIGQIAPLLRLGGIDDDDAIERRVQAQIWAWEEKRRRTLLEIELQELLDATLSPAERLFGTVYWASPLLIPDLHLMPQASQVGEVRHGVGIDRDTGAARDQIKYDFEVLPAGNTFALRMRCEMPTTPATFRGEWERLLALGLRLLEQGEVTLGGRAARGVGQVRLRDLEVYTLDTGDRAALLAALLADDTAARAGTRHADQWPARVLAEVA